MYILVCTTFKRTFNQLCFRTDVHDIEKCMAIDKYSSTKEENKEYCSPRLNTNLNINRLVFIQIHKTLIS